jgi:hypothetical protein
MRSLLGISAALFAICLTPPVNAEDAARVRPPPNPATLSGTQTGKERLGRKWMDEQRIDNCNVPIDKRGTKPRSSACRHVPTG